MIPLQSFSDLHMLTTSKSEVWYLVGNFFQSHRTSRSCCINMDYPPMLFMPKLRPLLWTSFVMPLEPGWGLLLWWSITLPSNHLCTILQLVVMAQTPLWPLTVSAPKLINNTVLPHYWQPLSSTPSTPSPQCESHYSLQDRSHNYPIQKFTPVIVYIHFQPQEDNFLISLVYNDIEFTNTFSQWLLITL